jgi:hypothetical protein
VAAIEEIETGEEIQPELVSKVVIKEAVASATQRMKLLPQALKMKMKQWPG